jgi:hypothetical protein
MLQSAKLCTEPEVAGIAPIARGRQLRSAHIFEGVGTSQLIPLSALGASLNAGVAFGLRSFAVSPGEKDLGLNQAASSTKSPAASASEY